MITNPHFCKPRYCMDLADVQGNNCSLKSARKPIVKEIIMKFSQIEEIVKTAKPGTNRVLTCNREITGSEFLEFMYIRPETDTATVEISREGTDKKSIRLIVK